MSRLRLLLSCYVVVAVGAGLRDTAHAANDLAVYDDGLRNAWENWSWASVDFASARPHDPVTYATRFKDYVQQMTAVDRSIKIGAVVLADEDSFAAIRGFHAARTAELFSYGIPQDEAARTGTGSAAVARSTAAVHGSTFTWRPAPYSVTVIRSAGDDRDRDDDDDHDGHGHDDHGHDDRR